MSDSSIRLTEAVEAFRSSPSYSADMGPSLSRLLIVCGRECPMFALSIGEVNQCVKEVKKAAERRKRVETLDAFFSFAMGTGWTRSNPVAGLVANKALPKRKPATPEAQVPKREAVLLSAEGREQLEVDIQELLVRKEKVIAEVAAAREEGDLKENAGYHDARERLGLIEGQLREKRDMLMRSAPLE